jgi:hypothetical protein
MQRFNSLANRPIVTNIEERTMFDSVSALIGGLGIEGVHSGAGFALSYSSTRRLACPYARAALPPVLASYSFEEAGCLDKKLESRQGGVDVSMTVSIPGALADRWLDAPGERDPQFFPVYARVSRAVQRAIRTWLPYLYFSRPELYEDLAVAAPLVVYQASRPFAGRPRYEFSYDVLSDSSMKAFYQRASARLSEELPRIEELLLRAGRSDSALAYSPKRARDLMDRVRRHPARLRSLLVVDTCLIDAFINLGCQAGQLRARKAENPRMALKKLTRLANRAARSLHATLRRLHGGGEFFALSSLLFVEATNALSGDAAQLSAIQATLNVSANKNGQSTAEAQTLADATWRPRIS